MEILNDRIIKLDKVLNKLDLFVLDFVKVLEKYTNYVVVSGFVSILFGRSRATEDIDLLVPKLEKDVFMKFFNDISKFFECINSSNPKEIYEDYLCKNNAVRFSYKDKPIPNIEFKFARTKIDYESLNKSIKVIIDSKKLFISPLELQIVFKEIVLASDKDIEDAEHLKTVFEKHLNTAKLKYYRRMLRNE